MCGIVSGIAQRDVSEILLEGLRRLEYRGYDSAGIATINSDNGLVVMKEEGKVARLESSLHEQPLFGSVGVAHTRWATHGKPSKENAHPQASMPIALVHNGIIENFEELKDSLIGDGYQFQSETDTEVIVHLIHHQVSQGDSLLEATRTVIKKLHGAYALAIINENEPDVVIAARQGSPLVIGVGIGEYFVASDQLALRQVTDRFVYLKEGDMLELTRDGFTIWDADQQQVERQEQQLKDEQNAVDKGEFRHFMLKEIYEQPRVLLDTMQGRLTSEAVLPESFGLESKAIFEQLDSIQIIACGTSYNAGLVAKYWFEELAGIMCSVEVASEFRYRKRAPQKNTLLITISQSGETADTLAALQQSKGDYIASLTVCNVAQSALVRESDIAVLTHAGPEIGVASTKAFTTQLTALLLLVGAIGKQNALGPELEREICQNLQQLPELIEQCLTLDEQIKKLAEQFKDKRHTLFLGRSTMYPIAIEGALKLKEISYIHAESYPAGELKHGPLALVDEDMPIVAVVPNNDLLDKVKSNLEEVHARGGKLFVFADADTGLDKNESMNVVVIPSVNSIIAPIVYTVPLQLFSYHVAVHKGTDVDQPRNLAKSVTVE
ncbi:MAG: glutamine--fructose-6-phosphate transaminase (isomerizing) [Pseudomonadota bacterium]